jgi:hypothetical protein
MIQQGDLGLFPKEDESVADVLARYTTDLPGPSFVGSAAFLLPGRVRVSAFPQPPEH